MAELMFKAAENGRDGGKIGGFYAEHDGYLCFIFPQDGGHRWEWSIQSGGGWTPRGGEDVVEHIKGIAFSTHDAVRQIDEWLETSD